MSRIRTATAAAVVASVYALNGPAAAQDDEVSALVACVLQEADAPCPPEVTREQRDEAIGLIAERTGNPPGQVRKTVDDVIETAGVTLVGPSAGADSAAAQADGEAEGEAQAEAKTEAEGAATAQAGSEAEAQTQTDQTAETEGNTQTAAQSTADAAQEPGEAQTAQAQQADTEASADASASASSGSVTPGPDATAEEIVEALSGLEDGPEREALLARLQEMRGEQTAAASQSNKTDATSSGASENQTSEAQTTEAEQPAPEEQARREELAQEAEQEAMQSQALNVVGSDSSSGEASGNASENAAVETQTEVVTEANSRSSSEDTVTSQAAADSSGNSGNGIGSTLRNILGAAAQSLTNGQQGLTNGQVLGTGDQVVAQFDDRVIVNRNGEYVALKDENTRLRRPGTRVETQEYADGSRRTLATRENGVVVETVRAPDGRTLYRARIEPDGRRTVLIDERQPAAPVREEDLRFSPQDWRVVDYARNTSPDTLSRALREAERARQVDRTFSLRQVLYNRDVRELMPRIDLDAITFRSGSAAIQPSQAQQLATLGRAMQHMIDENPDELFLVEGHTDTVGGEVMNLALSDRRAESVALALTEYFAIPPENMVTQGYGERFLKYAVAGDVRENRRAAVRRITPLIRTTAKR